jgi:DNA-binding transcriptional regulator YhcF (GntR family)
LSSQLRSALERRIASGRLLPGDRLPTVRELARELDLAPNTVAKAYRELEAGGFVVTAGRRGTFVAERLPEADATRALADAAEAFTRRVSQLGVSERDALAAVRAARRRREAPG